MATRHTVNGVEHTAKPVSPDELAGRIAENGTVAGGRFARLPEPLRPQDTTEATRVDAVADDAVVDANVPWRMVLYALDDA